MDENKEHILREKEWHNQTFGTDVRKKTKKYYSVKITNIFKNVLLKELNKKNDIHFLDYGCGSVGYLIEIADKIKKGIGIDISEVLIAESQKKAEENNINNLTMPINISHYISYFS